MRLLQGPSGSYSISEWLKQETKRDELFVKSQKLIAEKLGIDESKVTMDAFFRGDLGADSLDTYELVYAIEEEMGVSIPDDKANEFETVKDAYDYIKSQQQQFLIFSFSEAQSDGCAFFVYLLFAKM